MTKKKKKAARPAGTPKQKSSEPSKRSNYPLLVMAAGAVLLIVGGFYYYQSRPSMPASVQVTTTPAGAAQSGLQETRPTLPPEMFSGRVREAYAIARDIPQVLDQLYCYCRCRENFGHKNLLSCYVDNHAST